MKKTWILTLAALALALTAVAPALAAEAPPETAPVDLAQLLAQEEPNMTPADKPVAPDLVGLEEAFRAKKIRECEGDEWLQCSPSCQHCIYSGGNIYCVNC